MEARRSMFRAIGMDVHRDFCEVAMVAGGKVRSAGRVQTTPAALELFAASLAPDDRVGLEVTGNSGEIAIPSLTPEGALPRDTERSLPRTVLGARRGPLPT
jgi:hypothetical protein